MEEEDGRGGGVGGRTPFVFHPAPADELAAHPSLAAAAGGCRALHGDIAQAQREATLGAFRKGGALRCLVATDVAARGLDIAGALL